MFLTVAQVIATSSKLDATFIKPDNDSSQDLFRDTTNVTSHEDVGDDDASTVAAAQQQRQRQPHKFRKSGERTREVVRDENSSASDLSVEGVAKPMRKRKLGKKTSGFFNPV